MFDATLDGLRKWIAGLFVAAIKNTSRPEERQAAIQWLLVSRDILASDRPMVEKLKALNAQLNTRAAIKGVATAVADAARHYKTAKIPLAMKIAMPATVLALPFVGLHGAGLAAFGSAIGLPVLLLVFLGTAGITSVIETVALHPNSRAGIALVVASILQIEAVRRAKADFRRRMAEDAAAPQAAPMPDEEIALRAALLAMDPFDLEKHVMAFFDKAGLRAVVTPRSRDYGMDGYAAHPDGLIVVQCKRYVPPNKVGFEPIQRFKTVMCDAAAFRGYVVTTSTFTAGAVEYAASVPGMVLIDLDALVRWHREGWDPDEV